MRELVGMTPDMLLQGRRRVAAVGGKKLDARHLTKVVGFQSIGLRQLRSERTMDQTLNLVMARNPYARLVSGYYHMTRLVVVSKAVALLLPFLLTHPCLQALQRIA